MGLWSFLRRLLGKEDESPPTSLVFLLREPRHLNNQIVCQAVKNALGVDLSNATDASSEFVVGGEGLPTHVIQLQGRTFLVHSFPVPYFDDKELVAKEIADFRLRQAVLDHRAWLSVDALQVPEAGEDAYLVLGKLLAELADEDCLAIVAPTLQQMNPWQATLEATLRGPLPLDAVRKMDQVPIIDVAADDPLMLASVAEARRRWPEFVAGFEHRRPEQSFAVKAKFSEGETREFMWLQVTAIENDTIYGTLDSDPVQMKSLHAGSRVQVDIQSLNDWIFTKGKGTRGGFTIEAVRKAGERPRQ